MFSTTDIARIKAWIAEGLTGEQIAKELGLPLSTFRLHLANSGYRIITRRELETIKAVKPAAVLEGATA